jgi:hypothetical protein
MKELSAEQKAIAYDKVREKIAARFGSNIADEIFSQFEESEDESIIKEIGDLVESAPLIMGLDKDKIFAWLEKQGKQNTTWNEEDKRISNEIQCLISNYRTGDDEHKLCSWMDNLKYRVQPKKEWSEEDESMYIRTLGILGKCYMEELPTKVEEELNWFKSIKERMQPQPQWKPTDKDIFELQCVINNAPYNGFILKALLEQLKKLKEE